MLSENHTNLLEFNGFCYCLLIGSKFLEIMNAIRKYN